MKRFTALTLFSLLGFSIAYAGPLPLMGQYSLIGGQTNESTNSCPRILQLAQEGDTNVQVIEINNGVSIGLTTMTNINMGTTCRSEGAEFTPGHKVCQASTFVNNTYEQVTCARLTSYLGLPCTPNDKSDNFTLVGLDASGNLNFRNHWGNTWQNCQYRP